MSNIAISLLREKENKSYKSHDGNGTQVNMSETVSDAPGKFLGYIYEITFIYPNIAPFV